MVNYEVFGTEISNSIIGNTCRLHFSITFFDLEFRFPTFSLSPPEPIPYGRYQKLKLRLFALSRGQMVLYKKLLEPPSVNDRNIFRPCHPVPRIGSRSDGWKVRLMGISGRAIEGGGFCQCEAVPELFRLSVKIVPQSFYYCKIL
jgi:hypothetical protein